MPHSNTCLVQSNHAASSLSTISNNGIMNHEGNCNLIFPATNSTSNYNNAIGFLEDSYSSSKVQNYSFDAFGSLL